MNTREGAPKPSLMEDFTGTVAFFSLMFMLFAPVINIPDAEVALLPEEGFAGFIFVEALKKHLELRSRRTGRTKDNHLGHRLAHKAIDHVTAAQVVGRSKRVAS